MTSKSMRACVAGWFAAAAVGAGALGDGPKFTLIDDALAQSLISDPTGPTPGARGELIFSDARGVPRELSRTKVLALGPSWWTDPQSRPQGEAVGHAGLGLLVLTDGQRLPGGLSPTGAAGEALAWDHPRLGRVVVPLDRVSEVELAEPGARREPTPGAPARGEDGREIPAARPVVETPLAPPPTDRSRDTVELANGDRLAGLVERIGKDVVVSSGAAAAKATTVDIARVRRIWLANSAAAPVDAMVWLADGTVVGAKGFTITPGEPLRLGDWGAPGTPGASEAGIGQGAGGAGGGGGAAPYTVEEIAAAALLPRRVKALSDLTVREQTAPAGRKLVRGLRVSDDAFRPRALPAPLGARDIELPSAMTVEFALPAGASKVSALIELPEASWTWGDCRVKVEAVGGVGGSGPGGVLLDTRLNPHTPAAKLAAALPAGATGLRVSVEPGERGIVQDRVLIRRGLVLMAP